MAFRIACGLVVASSFLGVGGAANAQDASPPTLGGYAGTAAASGVHARYTPEGLLPTGPPIDLGAPDALATIASGPATFARASVLDPGDLLSNPDALLALASAEYEPGTIPAYPFRIAASSGVGQRTVESNPAPGLNARVAAEGGASSAFATMPALDAPAIARIGSMTSTATTKLDGQTVTVHARSEIGAIDILGILEIEQLVTDVTAVSSGGDTELTGGTTLGGVTLLGRPAVIDETGLTATLAGLDIGGLLETLGVKVSLPGPVELDGGNAGQLASTGLLIEIEVSTRTVPGLGDLLDAIPPIEPIIPGAPSVEDVLAVARARHLVSVEIGRSVVSLTGRVSTPRTTTPPASTPSTGTGTASPSLPSATPSLPPVPPPAPAGPVPAPALPAEVPASSVGTGIGALAVLLLLLQPILGDRLARGAAMVLATDQEGCQWERR